MDEKMKEMLGKVKDLRENYSENKEKLKREETQFKYENMFLLNTIQATKEELAAKEQELRDYAITRYNETGIKVFDFGVMVKLRKVMDYDPEVALKWAKEHNMALCLDKKQFEKIGKSGEIDIITISEKPMSTIPTKIVLEEEMKD